MNKELDTDSSDNIGKLYWYVDNKLGFRRTIRATTECLH